MGLIARYETHEQIGRGSMGEVYRARDIVLDRDVALKILRLGPDFDPELKERFCREAKAGARLLHPNITIIYDFGEERGVPYIAMELLSGADLRNLIDERKPLSLAQKVELLAQVCDGLAHAHKHGIVHRDIKPSNIFIHEERQAKVLDFGIARLPSSVLTQAGKILGTPNYMAPEQIRGQPCDRRSDLFSAAVVFYEFLALAHPFQGPFVPRRIVEGDPDSLFERDPLVPRALDKLLLKALEKRPEDRIQKAEDFAAGLRGVLDTLRSGLAARPTFGTSESRRAGESSGDSAPVPADEDSRGMRVAEFIRLLKEFEAAVEAPAESAAREALSQMRHLAASDGRLATGLEECERQFKDAFPEAADLPPVPPLARHAAVGSESPLVGLGERTKMFQPDPGPASPPPVISRAAVCPQCGTANRESAGFCLECGESLVLVTTPEAKTPDAPSTRPPVAVSLTPKWKEPTLAAARWVSQRTHRQKLVAGVACATMIALIGVVGFAWTRPVPVEPALGQAVVAAESANVLSQPSPAGKVQSSLRRGTRVNLTSRLDAPDQPWAKVQFVTSDGRGNQPSGFVRSEQLSDWSSKDPALAWIFIQRAHPPASAPDEALRRFVSQLREFADAYTPATQAAEAELERTRLLLRLVEHAKSANKTLEEYQADLKDAEESLNRAGRGNNDALWPDQRVRLTEEIAKYKVSHNVEPTEPKPEPSQVAALLARIPAHWEAAEYNEGLSLVNQILALNKENKKALWWKDRLTKALIAEGN